MRSISNAAKESIVNKLGGEEAIEGPRVEHGGRMMRTQKSEVTSRDGEFDPEIFKGEYCFLSSGQLKTEGTVTDTIGDTLIGDNFEAALATLKGAYFAGVEDSFRNINGRFYGFKTEDGLEIKMHDPIFYA
ncbi:MAG: hypothetical protein KAT77_00075 [Nanoarchaeota archaeon]|nr:hypothetical protein [Nanoarchaeota archaeon]